MRSLLKTVLKRKETNTKTELSTKKPNIKFRTKIKSGGADGTVYNLDGTINNGADGTVYQG